MNWYRKNRSVGNFLFAFAVTLFTAIWFLFQAKAQFVDALGQFNDLAAEHARLQRLNPFPNDSNFREMQTALEDYAASLDKAKNELTMQVVPLAALAPNEFQTRLHQAIVRATEKARTNRVKLPENFHLGFDEFAAALPGTDASGALGQQLNQLETLLNILLDNHVDAITDLKRAAVRAGSTPVAATGRKSATESPKVVERSVVDLAFTASPTALRKVLNEIASCDRQFFIVRTLYLRNEQPRGPSREEGEATASSGPPSAASTSSGRIKFIVGDEHLEAAISVELLRFTF